MLTNNNILNIINTQCFTIINPMVLVQAFWQGRSSDIRIGLPMRPIRKYYKESKENRGKNRVLNLNSAFPRFLVSLIKNFISDGLGIGAYAPPRDPELNSGQVLPK